MDIYRVSKPNVQALELLNLRESAEKIRELSKWTAQGMVEIGSELKFVKANLEHGKFENWIIENCHLVHQQPGDSCVQQI